METSSNLQPTVTIELLDELYVNAVRRLLYVVIKYRIVSINRYH